MRKIILSSFFAFLIFSSTLNAYELSEQIQIKWTGYKTEKKVAVSGTFKDISIDIEKSSTLTDFLKSAKVEIQTKSLDSNNSFRDKNITTTLFSILSLSKINSYISDVQEINKTLTLQINMNNIKKTVPMKYEILENKIIAKGMIDLLDFDMDESFSSFALKCAHYHENKSFSEVDIEFIIPFK